MIEASDPATSVLNAPRRTVPSGERFEAVDVLRGLAIFGMAFSGMVPDGLPAGMYHAQLPPPARVFDQHVFGISWVDLVFPFFLFSMGVSIPLALSRRLANGVAPRDLAWGAVQRGLMLVAFALIGEHFRPYTIAESPGPATLLLGLWGMALLIALFARLPQSWPERVHRQIRAVGWIGSLLTIVFIPYKDGRNGFANDRNDVILMVLANVAVSGTLIWLWTRPRSVRSTLDAIDVAAALKRFAIFGAVAVLYLARQSGGFGQAFWDYTPIQHLTSTHWPYLLHFETWPFSRFVPIFYHFEYHKYLLIVLPGTICGDLLLTAFPDAAAKIAGGKWPTWRYWVLAVGGCLASIFAVNGLLAREVKATTLAIAALVGLLLWAARPALTVLEQRLRALLGVGGYLLLVGLVAEPLGGGIRKDSPTFSYFLVTAGLGFLLLAGFLAYLDGLKAGSWLKPIAQFGANPILGYIAITNLVPAVFGLTGISGWVGDANWGPLPLTAYAFVKCVFLVFVTAYCTRRGLFLRA